MHWISDFPRSQLAYALILAVVFASVMEAKGQEAIHKIVPHASGLARVRVSQIETKKSVDLLPPGLCDPLNNGNTRVISFEIIEFTGYVKKKVFVEIPTDKKGLANKPLLNLDSDSVGESYWIAFTKSFARDSEKSEHLSGVAKLWKKDIDLDTKQLFQDAIDDDIFKDPPEYAPHLTDIGFGFHDAASRIDRSLPSMSYLNQATIQLKSQGDAGNNLLQRMLSKAGIRDGGGLGERSPPPEHLTAETQERISSVTTLHRKIAATRKQQLKETSEQMNDDELETILSDLSELEGPDAWQVHATQHGRVLWKRGIKGKSRAWEKLNGFNTSLPYHPHWIRFISDPQDLASWLPKKLLESELKFSRPNLSSLCAISSWEGKNFIKYFLDAKTGNRCLVLTYEAKSSEFNDSKLKSIREYSVEDKLVSERKFIFPECKDDSNVVVVKLDFDPTGRVSATKSLILESTTISDQRGGVF